MWLCTQFGFFSIVQKKPGEFHLRARLKRDLENLEDQCAKKYHPKKVPAWRIHRTAPADYRWRIVLAQPDLILVMACLADSIDYPNFKSRIHSLPDQCEKSSAYAVLWAGLHALQK